ncbi:MAG TPA: hypothetical protein VH277_04260 [Gemmatimonadaceae bacterium]|jgi:hypothetical protein|nr:hypothetical protein [Gemmatimonadaceae bacterium]
MVVVTTVSGGVGGATAVVVVSGIGAGAVYVDASFRIGIRWSDSALLAAVLPPLPRLFDRLTRLRFNDEPERRRDRQCSALVLSVPELDPELMLLCDPLVPVVLLFSVPWIEPLRALLRRTQVESFIEPMRLVAVLPDCCADAIDAINATPSATTVVLTGAVHPFCIESSFVLPHPCRRGFPRAAAVGSGRQRAATVARDKKLPLSA